MEGSYDSSLTFGSSLKLQRLNGILNSQALSNDPAAIRFPHVETVVFSDEEFINRWKARF